MAWIYYNIKQMLHQTGRSQKSISIEYLQSQSSSSLVVEEDGEKHADSINLSVANGNPEYFLDSSSFSVGSPELQSRATSLKAVAEESAAQFRRRRTRPSPFSHFDNQPDLVDEEISPSSIQISDSVMPNDTLEIQNQEASSNMQAHRLTFNKDGNRLQQPEPVKQIQLSLKISPAQSEVSPQFGKHQLREGEEAQASLDFSRVMKDFSPPGRRESKKLKEQGLNVDESSSIKKILEPEQVKEIDRMEEKTVFFWSLFWLGTGLSFEAIEVYYQREEQQLGIFFRVPLVIGLLVNAFIWKKFKHSAMACSLMVHALIFLLMVSISKNSDPATRWNSSIAAVELCFVFNSLFFISRVRAAAFKYTFICFNAICLLASSYLSLTALEEAGENVKTVEFFAYFGLQRVAAWICGLVIALGIRRIHKFFLKLVVERKLENDSYRRIFDQIDEALFVVEGEEVTFSNSIANTLLDRLHLNESERANPLSQELFYVCKEYELDEASPMTTNKENTLKSASSVGQGQRNPKRYSMLEIIQKREEAHQLIFTFNSSFAGCSSLGDISNLLQDMSKVTSASQNQGPSFNFFLIKIFRLANRRLSEDGSSAIVPEEGKEFAVKFIDISQKILFDNLSIERKYMAYMNSTVSHEMRNPLNSINCQLQVLEQQISDLAQLGSEAADLLPIDTQEVFEDIVKESTKCLRICRSSCKMLNFNVEDILALPQLKDRKFSKNIQLINLVSAVREVTSIQELQASDKGVELKAVFNGFEDRAGEFSQICLPMDEKRLQQVILNYQSNALKFMNKPSGKITILVQLVRKGAREEQEGFYKQIVKNFYGSIADFEADRRGREKFFSAFSADEDRLVVSVIDNGVGIKPAEQEQLYKLFGRVSRTRNMNTQGIGLGLVISKMITEEFGGMTNLVSIPDLGSIFQSTFKLDLQEEALSPSSFFEVNLARLRAGIDHQNFLQQARRTQVKRCLKNLMDIHASLNDFSFNDKKILVIDDESFNCQALAGMIKVLKLENFKRRVDFAYSGEQALQLLRENITLATAEAPITDLNKSSGNLHDFRSDSKIFEFSVDDEAVPQNVCHYGLIFTDCSMPFMDGYECCKQMHRILEDGGIPHDEQPMIVAVTGHVESEYKRKALISGMDQVYSKPIKADTVAMILLENKYKIKIPAALEQELMDRLHTMT